MPSKQLSRYHLQLQLHKALVRSTIAKEEGMLSRFESADLAIAKSIMSICKDT
jgi:hypothetical protein